MRLYVDANVFIYGTEVFDASFTSASRAILNLIRERRAIGITSEMTIAELFAPRRDGVHIDPPLRRAYAFGLERDFELVPVSRPILERTIAVRETMPMKLPDAVHCATALLAGCDAMITADSRLSRFSGIEVVAPNSDGLDILQSRLAS